MVPPLSFLPPPVTGRSPHLAAHNGPRRHLLFLVLTPVVVLGTVLQHRGGRKAEHAAAKVAINGAGPPAMTDAS